MQENIDKIHLRGIYTGDDSLIYAYPDFFFQFWTPEEAVDTFKTRVLELPKSEWKIFFENWFYRMKKCINFNREYFENKMPLEGIKSPCQKECSSHQN